MLQLVLSVDEEAEAGTAHQSGSWFLQTAIALPDFPAAAIHVVTGALFPENAKDQTFAF